MDFQVYKNKVLLKTRKAGQASVEYILILVVISTAVIGLVSFSDTIKGKIEMQKLNLAYKLGGTSYLSRSDFSFKNVEVKDVGGGAEDGAAAGGRRAGRGKSGANDDKDAAGKGPGAFGRGRTRGTGAGAGTEGEDEGDTDEAEETPEQLRARMKIRDGQAGGSVTYEKQRRRPGRRSGGQNTDAYQTEEEEKTSRFLKTKMEEDLREQEIKEEEMKKWNIMKFLVILAIVFLFIVIILKARNARD